MTLREKVEWAIAKIEERTDFDILAEMKAALNSVYGEERNQIVKPNADSIMAKWKKHGRTKAIEVALDGITDDEVTLCLLNTYADPLLKYHIIIHFPTITIRNNTKSHEIKDMYVQLGVAPKGNISTNLMGMRTTFTEAELRNGYVHSHLPSLDAKDVEFESFCLGVGEIKQVLAVLSHKYSTANFMMLLMHIRNFLEWESKEGTPYKYMESISNSSNRISVYNPINDSAAKLVAGELVNHIKSTMNVDEFMRLFKFTLTPRQITISPTLEAEKWLAKEIMTVPLRSIYGPNRNSFLSHRDVEGNYYSISASGRGNYEKGTILKFKGKEIKLEITEKTGNIDNETYANPKVTKETCKELSHAFTKAAITAFRAKSSSPSAHKSKSTESSEIPL